MLDPAPKAEPIGLDALIERIHDAPAQFVLAITGGGSRAICELLERPGGSRVLLEAAVPYSSAALVDFLHATPEQFCSARTARMMAMAAYQRARELRRGSLNGNSPLPEAEGNKLLGLGCTASLASNRPKRGDHRIHVAWQTRDSTAEYSVTLVKEHRTRFEEEAIATSLVLNTLSDGCVEGAPQLDLGIRGDESLGERRAVADRPQQELMHGDRRQVLIGRAPILATGERRAVFPGAFNPLHDGHRAMAELASKRLKMPVEFELSIHNVDKPPLDYLEIGDRVAQFTEDQTLWLTRAPTFDEKSRLFADATFIVGADTIARIAAPAYYGGSETAMLAAIDRIAGRGGRFLVFGRASAGQFQSLDALNLPATILSICDQVGEAEFRADVSSTELRNRAGAG
jgi:nicotinic acid mononucleotide adenylyltransferase